jgi:ribokinase
MPHRLICYGDLCVDIVVRVSSVPKTGEDATVDQLQITTAGAASNCAVAAAAHGIGVELLGAVGTDAFGGMVVDSLVAAGVGAGRIHRLEGRTGMVISIVQPDGERTLYSHRGVNAAPCEPAAQTVLRDGDCLYLSGYSFQTQASRRTAGGLASLARTSGARCALDPSFQFARDVRQAYPEALGALDFIFPNQQEAALMTGLESPPESAAALRSLGVANVIVKLGGQGCYVDTAEAKAFVPTRPLNVTDSTGAGDAFCGVFLAAILSGADAVQAAERANLAAGSVVTRCGAQAAAW